MKSYISHSSSAVKVSFYMAEFFVNEGRESRLAVATSTGPQAPDLPVALICVLAARKNKHRFQSEAEEHEALIYNYSPVYNNPNSTFVQIYYFWFNLTESIIN